MIDSAEVLGTIRMVDPQRGYGFVRTVATPGRDYFFHCSGLQGVRIDDLCVGDTVTFEPTTTARGPRAEVVRRV